jgi:hypothetical protein
VEAGPAVVPGPTGPLGPDSKLPNGSVPLKGTPQPASQQVAATPAASFMVAVKG